MGMGILLGWLDTSKQASNHYHHTRTMPFSGHLKFELEPGTKSQNHWPMIPIVDFPRGVAWVMLLLLLSVGMWTNQRVVYDSLVSKFIANSNQSCFRRCRQLPHSLWWTGLFKVQTHDPKLTLASSWCLTRGFQQTTEEVGWSLIETIAKYKPGISRRWRYPHSPMNPQRLKSRGGVYSRFTNIQFVTQIFHLKSKEMWWILNIRQCQRLYSGGSWIVLLCN